jgi:hypothetical protein
MAIHSKTEDMLKESLEEMFIAAQLCIEFKKENEGCLGYPAAILLLAIADTIGSYYEGNKNFTIQVDGKNKVINTKGFQHFYILNSNYYDLQLSELSIKKIYDNYRSLLIHNAVIAKEHFITLDDPLRRSFAEDGLFSSMTGKPYPTIYLKPLLKTTAFAISKFTDKIDKIFSVSKQGSIIAKK